MDSNQAVLKTELFLCWILKSAQKTESHPQKWHIEVYRLIFFDNIIHSKWLEDQINFFFFYPSLQVASRWQTTVIANYVKSSSNTKFFGLIIDDSLSWKAHIDQMMSKMNTACFIIKKIQAIMSPETLRMVYFAYVHSIMSYGIILGGNQPYSEKIFKIQKRVIRIITKLNNSSSKFSERI